MRPKCACASAMAPLISSRLLHVHLERQGAPAHRLDLLDERRAALLPPKAKRHVGAGMRERQRGGAAKPARRGGDERHLAAEIEARIVHRIPPFLGTDLAEVERSALRPAQPFALARFDVPRGACGRPAELLVEICPRIAEKPLHGVVRDVRLARGDRVEHVLVARQENLERVARKPVAHRQADADQVPHLQKQVIVGARENGAVEPQIGIDRRRCPG